MDQIDTAIVFSDLKNAFERLQENRTSPQEVRRRFATFLTLTQQLTSIMRVEFKTNTNMAWAPDFKGWTKTTELFKKLRNVDQHEFPATIGIKCVSYFQLLEGEPHKAHSNYQSQIFQISDILPPPPTLKITDDTGNHEIQPFKNEYTFTLKGRTKTITDLLSELESNEIHKLSHDCFSVLEKYYQFYLSTLSKHSK